MTLPIPGHRLVSAMEITLCGVSAFRYYRVPPQILGLYPRIPDVFQDSNHLKAANSFIVQDLLQLPLHRAVFDRRESWGNKLYDTHLIKGELPFGSVRETDHGFAVTSPAVTLLTLARDVSRLELLMAVYEMTGEFAVFNPCARAEEQLDDAERRGYVRFGAGWRRVANVDGNGTSLWRRPALIDVFELESFCDKVPGFHGVKDLRWAVKQVTGTTASPFEVQASMLLGLPRSAGGEGLAIQNNQRINLSPTARRIYPHDCCYADILIEGKGRGPGVVIECQGRSVHASEAAGISDSDRATALMSMGYEVILATFDQFFDVASFEAVLDLIAKKTGIRRREKTARQLAAQAELRRSLFIDWSTLGS